MKIYIKLFALWVVLAAVFTACEKDETTTPTTPGGSTKSTAKAITKFSFSALTPTVEGVISGTAITATVPATGDLTKLVPTIAVSDKAAVSPATGTAQDFSKEVSYTVTAEDGSTQVFKVNVTKAGGTTGGTGFSGENLVFYNYSNTFTDPVTFKSTTQISIKAYDAITGKEAAGSIALGTSVYGDGTYDSDYKAYPVMYNKGVLFAFQKDKMTAFTTSTGKVKWSTAINELSVTDGSESQCVIDNGTFFTAGRFSKLPKIYALTEDNGSKKWEFSVDDTQASIKSLTVLNGILYATIYSIKSGGGGLIAIDVNTGKEKWSFKNINVSSANPVVVNGIVYFSNYSNILYALDAITGIKKWEFSSEAPYGYGSLTLSDGVLFASNTNSTNPKIFALDAVTGTKKWEFTDSGKDGQRIRLSGDASNLYVTVSIVSGVLYALDKKSGAKKWETSAKISDVVAPVVANGLIYYSTDVFDTSTGASKKFGISSSRNFVVVIGGKYYGSSSSGMVQ